MDEPVLRLRVAAVASEIRDLRDAVGALGARVGLDAERVADLRLAVSEAVGNAVMHAYPDGEAGWVEVEAGVEAGALEVVVRDAGVGLRPRADSPGAGYGLQLIEALADAVQADAAPGGGTRVRFRFVLDAA